MSDYGTIYLIDTEYNAERDATEVSFGYLEKEEQLKGRIRTLRIIVNVQGHRDDRKGAIDEGLRFAREFVSRAAQAPYESE
jgi:hypothetical protein